jgi:hypothetical protein
MSANWVEDAIIDAIDKRAAIQRDRKPIEWPRVIRHEEAGASFANGRIIVRGSRGLPRLVVVESRSSR